MSEAVYDEQIAPKLAELAKLCKEHGMPFLAIVEYAHEDFGQTTVATPKQSMPMTMANIAARCRGNLDSFVISLLRYCNEQGIDTSASMVANRMTGGARGVTTLAPTELSNGWKTGTTETNAGVTLPSATFKQGNWAHPDGDGSRIVGWRIPATDVERMGADAYRLPGEVVDALSRLASNAGVGTPDEGQKNG